MNSEMFNQQVYTIRKVRALRRYRHKTFALNAHEGIQFVIGTAPTHGSVPQIKMAQWLKTDK